MEFNREQILKPYAFNLAYAHELVSDFDDKDLYLNPSEGLENHPGFTLGHLVSGSMLVARSIGLKCSMSDSWEEFFLRKGPGDPTLPINQGADLPSKKELLDELDKKHAEVTSQIKKLENAKFYKPCEWRFQRFFPTIGDMLMFMCVTHEAMHLAQVAAWRRHFKYDSSLGRMK